MNDHITSLVIPQDRANPQQRMPGKIDTVSVERPAGLPEKLKEVSNERP